MKLILFVATFLAIVQISSAQVTTSESFTNVTDPFIKNEVAVFNVKGLSSITVPSEQTTLTEIPLLQCDKASAYFHVGDTHIHLYFKPYKENATADSVRKLDSI